MVSHGFPIGKRHLRIPIAELANRRAYGRCIGSKAADQAAEDVVPAWDSLQSVPSRADDVGLGFGGDRLGAKKRGHGHHGKVPQSP
jgi:hypothetical protein